MDKSKYYYDYTRNMSYEQAEKFNAKINQAKENNSYKYKAKNIFTKQNQNWTNTIKNGKGSNI